jgi:hypothetical protein
VVVQVHEAGAGESNTWTREGSLIQLASPPTPKLPWTAKVIENILARKNSVGKSAFKFHESR